MRLSPRCLYIFEIVRGIFGFYMSTRSASWRGESRMNLNAMKSVFGEGIMRRGARAFTNKATSG
jgi:hypothetical protein